MSLILAPDLYTKPPRGGVDGMQFDFRSIELTAAQVVNDNIVAMGVVPSGQRLVGLVLEVDDLDTGNAITLNIGLLNSRYNEAAASVAAPGTDDGTAPALVSGKNLVTSGTTAQAGGRLEISALACTESWSVDNSYDRIVAVEFKAISSAQGGTLNLGIITAPA
jgi:hypothetical protein